MRGGVPAEPTDRTDVHRVRVLLSNVGLAEPLFLENAHRISTALAFTGELPSFS